MAVLTVEQILDICTNVAESTSGIYEFSSIYFNLALGTGLRDIEMTTKSRWTSISDTNFLVDTAKGSKDRIVAKVLVPQTLLTFFESSSTVEFLKSARELRRNFKKFAPNGTLSVGERGVSVYMYRYNICKQMFFVQGKTVQEISNYIGEVENANTLRYINAQVQLIT